MDAPKFEKEALRIYTEMVMAETSEGSNSDEAGNQTLERASHQMSGVQLFLAKRAADNEELFIHNSEKPEMIDEFMKDV